MRRYDIAYVPNGQINYYPPKNLEDMTLDEIKEKHIKTCGKANGDTSVCSRCQTPCREGKRAIQLLANQIYNDPPIPLYGGKTLIEKAREENMKRREQMNGEKKKKEYIRRDGWWEDSLASGDQVKWLMTNLGINRTQAKKKIYQYKWNHGMAGAFAKHEKTTNTGTPIVYNDSSVKETSNMDMKIEEKLEALMKQQEEHKKAMDHYMKCYYEEKAEYEKYKQQADVLCNAMDILNGV